MLVGYSFRQALYGKQPKIIITKKSLITKSFELNNTAATDMPLTACRISCIWCAATQILNPRSPRLPPTRWCTTPSGEPSGSARVRRTIKLVCRHIYIYLSLHPSIITSLFDPYFAEILAGLAGCLKANIWKFSNNNCC